MIHVLTVTALYPNREQIRNGVFVQTRLQKLLEAEDDIRITVVAPVPWFPLRSRRFGRYGTFARVPREEQDGRIRVLHPRYLQIPKVGELVAPLAYYWSVKRCLRSRRVDDFDLIDSHFAFPDGVGAVMLARSLRKPVCITVRGSDVNIIARERIAGRWVRWALSHCQQVIAVSRSLAARVEEILSSVSFRAPDEFVAVVRNGVDLTRFQMSEGTDSLRTELGLGGPVIVSVGNLIPLKGHDLVIKATARIPDATLCIIGRGPEESNLIRLAQSLGIEHRVRFCGEMPQHELVRYYNAADVTVLASSHEGLPNVILESLACGTPVVATRVGGVPEILTDPGMGIMLDDRTDSAIAEAVVKLSFKSRCQSMKTRASVRAFDWNRTAAELMRIFRGMTSEGVESPGGQT